MHGTATELPGYASRRSGPFGGRTPFHAGAAIALIVLLLFVLWLIASTPLRQALVPVATPSLTLMSEDGVPILRRGPIVDEPVDPAALPAHVPQAFLAIEDRRFYRHNGIELRGMIRAAWRNLAAGGVREGGSTITQQLAKITALNADRTAMRKLREVIIAFWLELNLSKDEILGRYLSGAYFGDNVYGLRAAAHHYFNRSPEELTIGQAAMLAGLVNAPSRLAPTRNMDGARDRADLVVNAMVDAGFLDADAAAALPEVELEIGPVRDLPAGSYFGDWILGRIDEEGLAGPTVVQTTLDSRLQRMAVEAVTRARLGGAQVALVAMRPDGRVAAMVGGRSYAQSPFNRAVQARRQPGSTFKLFVYLAALREGMGPETLVDDYPIRLGDWEPTNYNDEYRGRITLRDAFAVSSNSAAVQLSEVVGRDRVIRLARELGVTSDLVTTPSLALGTSEMTLIELTAAFAAVAGGAGPVRPAGIADEVRRPGGALSPREREMMLDLLWQAANAGTGRAAALRTPTFGKTGTSQGHRDALFVGFAGDLVTGVWIGHDDNRPLPRIAGGGLPAEIWRDFMSRATGSAPAGRAAAAPLAARPATERSVRRASASAPREARRAPARAERGKARGKGKGRGRGRGRG